MNNGGAVLKLKPVGGGSVPGAGMFEEEDEPPGEPGLPSPAFASSVAAEEPGPAPLPADPETAFAASFEAELSRLHEAMQHAAGGDPSAQILDRLATLRAMSSRGEFALSAAHAERVARFTSARAEAREWVELRLHELVASFHLASHEDNDLLAMDAAVRAARSLVARAAGAVGDMSIFGEILDALERQLRAKLELVIKKANRHELRLLYTYFLLRPVPPGAAPAGAACASAAAAGGSGSTANGSSGFGGGAGSGFGGGACGCAGGGVAGAHWGPQVSGVGGGVCGGACGGGGVGSVFGAGGKAGSSGASALGGWPSLRALCLRKYREQVEKHVHSESVVAMSALHKVLADRQATIGNLSPEHHARIGNTSSDRQAAFGRVGSSGNLGHVPPDRHANINHSTSDHHAAIGRAASSSCADSNHARSAAPSLAAVEAEEAIGFPAVGVIRSYLEGIARVADELQDGGMLPVDFVASAHAELEQVSAPAVFTF